MKILAHTDYQSPAESGNGILVLANDVNVLDVNLDGVTQIDLHFPPLPMAAPSHRPTCCAAAASLQVTSAPRAMC